jgi:ketosteroid isomerase-like protein
VEIVSRMFESFGQLKPEDLQAFLDEFVDPDVDWRAVEGAIDDVGGMRGTEAVRLYIADWLDTFDDLTFTPDEVIEVDVDRVLICQRFGGRAKQSGIETQLSFAAVCTIRNRRLVTVREYRTREEALEAVELSEQAMSQENVEIVRAAIDAFNRGDLDAMFQDMAPGFELDMSRAVGPVPGHLRLDQARRNLVEFAESWESLRIEPHEFIETGDLVVVPHTLHVKGREGIEVVSRPTFVWTIRDGAIERVSMYQERQDALEAVGLSEQDAHADS